MISNNFLFVYGTLRQAFKHPLHTVIVDCCEFVGLASTCAQLYELGGYPGLIESLDSSDQVFGELYAIHNQQRLFAELDNYEQCSQFYSLPHEYIRKKLMIHCHGQCALEAWVYVYNYDVSHSDRLHSGDYLSCG